MDIRMPMMDGLEATRILKAANIDLRVLILTTWFPAFSWDEPTNSARS
jgi:DNA-binding NarL/FixJ family response regulator